jgi:hypothetical protein
MKLVATLLVLAVLGVRGAVLQGRQSALAAADLTGNWQLHLDPDFGGHDDTKICAFRQEERKLTIQCETGPPIPGDVDGDKVTFRPTTGRQNEFTAVFNATLDAQAKTMKGTWRLDTGREVRNGKFDATRAAR